MSTPHPGAPHFHWYLPTTGDGREVTEATTHRGYATARRAPDLEYLTLVAETVDRLGFESVLTPTGTWCDDSWIVASALIAATRRLKFLVAFRPGLISPTLAAQQAAALANLSGGRLALNVVTGGDQAEQARFGDHLSKDERYARTTEFLDIVRHAWTGVPYDFTGEYYDVRGAVVATPPSPVPEIFFGGASEAGRESAARQADTYLTWTEPPAAVGRLVDDVRARAAKHDRFDSAQDKPLSFGIRAHVITRDTHDEAWAEARKLLDRMDPATIALARRSIDGSQSEGQRRQAALSADPSNLEVHPGLWAGFGLVRGGAGTALVGSHEEVADLIQQYRDVGIDHFVLSGNPHIEEAYRFAEGVTPLFDESRSDAPSDAAADLRVSAS
ncbi:MAG: LLM class flavin-dependent oxidoreductase [Gordonia sp. (in: high G+C Gram-positive bacteria)]|uniref:LLM class flavin-dependent oxidoreductase n=1 Tax=Gordonia sp. (in: high G+C Gram-positive bacteria) TaxID=84139 RepID=UPI0039E6AD57